MFMYGRDTISRGHSHFDILTVLHAGRKGFFEGSLTLQSVKGASYGHPLVGKTWPLCWGANRDSVEIERNQTATVYLAEFYRDVVEREDWKTAVIGWDPNGLVPCHMVNDPTAEFHLRLRIWRSGWLSDILARILLDEEVIIRPMRKL